MSYSPGDLTAIQSARLRGLRTVQFADRSVTYQSDAEMRQVESDIRRDLARSALRPRQFAVATSKGLGR